MSSKPWDEMTLAERQEWRAEWERQEAARMRERQKKLALTERLLGEAGVVKLCWQTYWDNDEDQMNDLEAQLVGDVPVRWDQWKQPLPPGVIEQPSNKPAKTYELPVTYRDAEELCWHLQEKDNRGNGEWVYDLPTKTLTYGGYYNPRY
jgi:hypothetical protein